MESYTYIPLGCNCHPAYCLKKMKLRKFSLPFDWLLMKNSEQGLLYVAKQVETNFEYFVDGLLYNDRKKVISKHYPYIEFFHHDLLENSDNINKFKLRGQRFMNIIKNDKIIFLYCIPFKIFKDKNKLNVFKSSIDYFVEIISKKCNNFKLIIYFCCYEWDFDNIDLNDVDIIMDSFVNYKKKYSNNIVKIDKFYVDKNIRRIWGDIKKWYNDIILNNIDKINDN